MVDDNYTALLRSMRDKCQRRNWYGSDLGSPATLRGYLGENGRGTFFWYDRDGKKYPIRRDTDISLLPVLRDFEYPPASEEQLLATEETLGFALPPLLRACYAQLANGGFGPGYGLHGANGGFGDMVLDYLAVKRRERLVDFADYERRQTSSAENIMLPDYVWPDQFLSICHWGCAIYSYLDVSTSRIFRAEYYGDNHYGFILEAASLEQWLSLWADDKLSFEIQRGVA
jgi:hypothetical protein